MKYLHNISVLFLLLSLPALGMAQSPVIDSLANLIKKDNPDTNKVDHLNGLGWELMYDNPDNSILLSKQALLISTSLAEGTKDTNLRKTVQRRVAQSYNCLGVYYLFFLTIRIL